MNRSRRLHLAALAAAAASVPSALSALSASAPAFAQAPGWPNKPLRIVVGFPPGSTPDMAARIVAEPLARALGQAVVVENKPGASGNIAADLVAKATDEHTLGVVINGNLTSAAQLNPKLPYDPAKDFAFVSQLTAAPLVLVTTPEQPAGAEFFAAARAGGDKWNYGSVGIGSVGHLGMELLASKTGLKPLHVPFKGNPDVVTAMLAGQIQMSLIPPGVAMPQVRAGKLRAVGLAGGKSPLVPELPPLSEAGVRDVNLEVWTALIAPASLPAAAQARLAATVPALLRDAEVRSKLTTAGWEPIGSTAEGLKARVQSEAAALGAIIATKGIRTE